MQSKRGQDRADALRLSSPMLEQIGSLQGRIFDLYREPDGTFAIVDGCDEWFSVHVTADELKALGEELVAIAKAAKA